MVAVVFWGEAESDILSVTAVMGQIDEVLPPLAGSAKRHGVDRSEGVSTVGVVHHTHSKHSVVAVLCLAVGIVCTECHYEL